MQDIRDVRTIEAIAITLGLYGLSKVAYGLSNIVGLLTHGSQISRGIEGFIVFFTLLFFLIGSLFMRAGIMLWKSKSIDTIANPAGVALGVLGGYFVLGSLFEAIYLSTSGYVNSVIAGGKVPKLMALSTLLNDAIKVGMGIVLIQAGRHLRINKLEVKYLALFVILMGLTILNPLWLFATLISMTETNLFSTSFKTLTGFVLIVLGIKLLRSGTIAEEGIYLAVIVAAAGIWTIKNASFIFWQNVVYQPPAMLKLAEVAGISWADIAMITLVSVFNFLFGFALLFLAYRFYRY
ncbi:hypothetical protein, partial [Candidatus Pyrohabitans sp.]